MSKIARLIIASGESSPDMRYAAGFSTPDEFIWFEANGDAGVICSPLEFSRAVKQARPGVTVYTEAEFGGPGRIDMLKNLAARLRVQGFLVPPEFPLLWADRLREAGLAVRAADGTYFPEREFKSAQEVEKVVESQRAAEAGVRRAFDVLRESRITSEGLIEWRGGILTSEMLRSEIDIAMVRLGMEPTGTICARRRAGGAAPQHRFGAVAGELADRDGYFSTFGGDRLLGRPDPHRGQGEGVRSGEEGVRRGAGGARTGQVAGQGWSRSGGNPQCGGAFDGAGRIPYRSKRRSGFRLFPRSRSRGRAGYSRSAPAESAQPRSRCAAAKS